jgi:uncharacterized protein (DUF1330 family)
MAAYVIANVNVQDAATFEEYRPACLVVLEFPSMEQARRWYDSDEHREPKALRMKCAMTDVVFVEGA